MKLEPPNHNGLSEIEGYFSHRKSKIILDWLMSGSYKLNYLESRVIEVCLLQPMASNPTQTLMPRCSASKKEKRRVNRANHRRAVEGGVRDSGALQVIKNLSWKA